MTQRRDASDAVGGSRRGRKTYPGVRSFDAALCWIGGAWAVVTAVTAGAAAVAGRGVLGGLTPRQWGLISLFSLAIHGLSLVPGLLRRRRGAGQRGDRHAHDRAKPVAAGASDASSAGLGILPEYIASVATRLVGTIALFMLCRYQLSASPTAIALWVLGWYVVLSAAEVFAVVKTLSTPAAASAQPPRSSGPRILRRNRTNE